MEYELAKKLKEAGFPNIRIGDYFEHRVGSHSDDRGGESDYPCYCNEDKFPTLSELIEACGKRFLWLKKDYDNGEWYAEGYALGIVHLCKTPEEAVANLWLELNKK